MTQSVVCGECGATMPVGRLSCPGCGAMLATVAGVGRRIMGGASGVAVATAPLPEPDPLDEILPMELPWAGPLTSDAELDLGLDGMMDAPDSPEAALHGSASDDAIDDFFDMPDGDSGLDDGASIEMPVVETSAAFTSAGGRSAGGAVVGTATGVTPGAPTPGSYVPPMPAGTGMTSPAVATSPAGAAAPARAWAGYADRSADPHYSNGHLTDTDRATTDADVDPVARKVIDLAGAKEFVGWLAVAGSMLAIVGFLLPWSSITVIGSSGVGYLDRWGLAGPWHVLAVLGLIGLLAAAIMRDRVPPWAGIGLPGLGLGALLVGLVWPYLVGPLAGSLGAMAVGLGALLCVAAGIAAIVVDRHASPDPGV